MDINGAVGVLVALVTLAAAGGAAVAFTFLRNVSRATLETYKEDNEALRHRVDTLEGELMEDRAHVERLSAEVARLSADNELLRGIVPGTSAIEALDGKVERYHAQAMAQMRLIGGALADIARGGEAS